jgi:hypothetical protein
VRKHIEQLPVWQLFQAPSDVDSQPPPPPGAPPPPPPKKPYQPTPYHGPLICSDTTLLTFAFMSGSIEQSPLHRLPTSGDALTNVSVKLRRTLGSVLQGHRPARRRRKTTTTRSGWSSCCPTRRWRRRRRPRLSRRACWRRSARRRRGATTWATSAETRWWCVGLSTYTRGVGTTERGCGQDCWKAFCGTGRGSASAGFGEAVKACLHRQLCIQSMARRCCKKLRLSERRASTALVMCKEPTLPTASLRRGSIG